MAPSPHLHVAVPAQDELDSLPSCLEGLRQPGPARTIWFCVNQPESWRGSPEGHAVCESNARSLELLKTVDDLELRILDRSSPGEGWPPKRGGVGQARRELMDAIAAEAADHDLIVSLDADTLVEPGYLESVRDAFAAHPEACGLASRYYHPRVEDDRVTRAMLGYEIYMRYYVLNMWRIGSPFSFTALGSALALPVGTYRKIGGLTPRTSGEDFYFLQKLVKVGRVLHWSEGRVSPGTRISERVPVGTGQAIRAACEGLHADRYPLYPSELFDDVGHTAAAFPKLFDGPAVTPLDDFLKEQLRTEELWQGLRENHPTRPRFVRACHERLDGLRILQYLKTEYRREPVEDSRTLADWMRRHGGDACEPWLAILDERPLQAFSTDELDALRQLLFEMEDRCRKADFHRG